MKNNTHHEPLIRVMKNDAIPAWRAWLVGLISVVLALLVCAVIIVAVTGLNPIEFYTAMIKGSFGTNRKFWMMLQKVAMLLCISLAVTPAFKMKFWNIGAEGQVLIGGLATAACMIYFNNLPTVLLLIVMIGVSILAGAVWGIIPAVMKAKFNTNDTLFTLMMNYVAIQLVSFCITFWENPQGSNTVGIINPNSQVGWVPSLFGQKYLLNVLIVSGITIFMYIYLKSSKHGYEISVVGESENTAKYVGINVKKVIVRTMALSGALCGVAGFLLVAGTDHTISTETAGGQGFTAILVSWLAKFNPFVMIFTSFILVFLGRGASEIATTFRLNESVSEILSGIILFFIIGSEFFINYKIQFRKKHRQEVSK